VQLTADSWHEADRLFYNNPQTPQWKGADVANSVALDADRILWVFGDTLLAEPGANHCNRFDQFNILVHNSLAVQYGTDPTKAQIRHFWGQHDSEPTSFFSPQEHTGSWYWMGGVTVVNEHALVFLMHARSTDGNAAQTEQGSSCAGLSFEMLGWEARIAKITPQNPDRWDWRSVSLPDDTYWHQILVGSSSVYADADFLYAWSAGPAGLAGNPVFLARWPLASVASADLSTPQWYTADDEWVQQATLGYNLPRAIVEDGNNEVSVGQNVWPQERPSWGWLQSTRVINSPLCFRSAETPLNFGECIEFMEPPELRKYPHSTLLVYAVKFHPALTGQGENTAIATYVVNSCELRDIQDNCDLYYPRFIKLQRPN
jgi:hypothetical protein